MFKGPNFVYNHIYNKHFNLINEFVDKEISIISKDKFYDYLKFNNYVKDPNKIYEKYKIVSNMDEYLNYLNIVKGGDRGDGDKTSQSYHYKKNSTPSQSFRHKKRREFKDLDEPETGNSTNPAMKRKLISYDDL